MNNESPWFVALNQPKKINYRLFCFPYAGGGASSFRKWIDILPDHVQIIAIQLPGREGRYNEPLLSDLQDIIKNLITDILLYVDIPFVFFGHSLGGLIAYEMIRSLESACLPTPNILFLSSVIPPSLFTQRKCNYITQLANIEFIDNLSASGGLPKKLLDNQDLLAIYLPIIRADLAILEKYECDDNKPLNCYLVAIGGQQDIMIAPEDIESWQSQTTKKFKLKIFDGDHFYIYSKCDELVNFIDNLICNWENKIDGPKLQNNLERAAS